MMETLLQLQRTSISYRQKLQWELQSINQILKTIRHRVSPNHPILEEHPPPEQARLLG